MKLKQKKYYDYEKELYNVINVEGKFVGLLNSNNVYKPLHCDNPYLWEVNDNMEIVGTLIEYKNNKNLILIK